MTLCSGKSLVIWLRRSKWIAVALACGWSTLGRSQVVNLDSETTLHVSEFNVHSEHDEFQVKLELSSAISGGLISTYRAFSGNPDLSSVQESLSKRYGSAEEGFSSVRIRAENIRIPSILPVNLGLNS